MREKLILVHYKTSNTKLNFLKLIISNKNSKMDAYFLKLCHCENYTELKTLGTIGDIEKYHDDILGITFFRVEV